MIIVFFNANIRTYDPGDPAGGPGEGWRCSPPVLLQLEDLPPLLLPRQAGRTPHYLLLIIVLQEKKQLSLNNNICR